MPALGRGGAGNIEAATLPALQRKISGEALEKGSLQRHHEAYAGTSHDALHTQEYAHMGRGGAGNYYSPRELNATGEFTGAGTSHVLGDGTPEGRAVAGVVGEKIVKKEQQQQQQVVAGPVYRGRGGAGNYAFGVTEGEERRSRKKFEDEEARKREIRGVAEGVAQEGLAVPEKARLPGGQEPY